MVFEIMYISDEGRKTHNQAHPNHSMTVGLETSAIFRASLKIKKKKKNLNIDNPIWNPCDER